MRRTLSLVRLCIAACLALAGNALATDYPLPAPSSRLIGENKTVVVPNDGRPLEAIAAENQIGFLNMIEANPGTDPWLPKAGSLLILPEQMILPNTPREGIVINLAELRLYYYPPGGQQVTVYPIGIGQLGRETPVMTTSIIQKIPNPTWTPTPNIRKRYAEEGITLPAVVPAGPNNPMGAYALRLAQGHGEYLIHGTNANFGIGLRVSSGCIRLRPQNIEALFNAVSTGTRVQVVNEPIKFTVEPDGRRYIEVHQPLSRNDKDDPQSMPITLTPAVQAFLNDPATDRAAAEAEIRRRSGLPVLVSRGMTASPQTAQGVPSDAADPAAIANPDAPGD